MSIKKIQPSQSPLHLLQNLSFSIEKELQQIKKQRDSRNPKCQRCDNLRKQLATKEEEISQVRKDYTNQERNRNQHDISLLKSENSVLLQQLQQSRKQIAALKVLASTEIEYKCEKQLMEQSITRLNSGLSQKTRELSMVRSQLSNLQARMSTEGMSLHRQISQKDMQVFKLNLSLEQQHKKVKLLKEHIQKINFAQDSSLYKRLDRNQQETNGTNSRKDQQIVALQEENKQLRQHMRVEGKLLHQLQSKKQNFVAQEKELQGKIHKLIAEKHLLERRTQENLQKETRLDHKLQEYKYRQKQAERKVKAIVEQQKVYKGKIKQLEEEKVAYKNEIYQLQKKLKRKKIQQKGDKTERDEPDFKLRLLKENMDNLVIKLDEERIHNRQLEKQLQNVPDQEEGRWLIGFFKAYNNLVVHLKLSISSDFVAIRDQLLQRFEKSQNQDNEIMEDMNLEMISKIKELQKSRENGLTKEVILAQRLRTENIFLKMLTNSQGLQAFSTYVGKLQTQNRFINRRDFEEYAFYQYERQKEKVIIHDSAKASESFIKTIFIFFEDVIKVFDGHHPCLQMMGEVHDLVHVGFASLGSQTKITLLLEKIKDWLIHKIKSFRRRLSKIISSQEKNLTPIQEEEQEEIPMQVITLQEVKDLEAKLRVADLRIMKLMDYEQSVKYYVQELQNVIEMACGKKVGRERDMEQMITEKSHRQKLQHYKASLSRIFQKR